MYIIMVEEASDVRRYEVVGGINFVLGTVYGTRIFDTQFNKFI